MICSRCGAENAPDATFCRQCGLPLLASAQDAAQPAPMEQPLQPASPDPQQFATPGQPVYPSQPYPPAAYGYPSAPNYPGYGYPAVPSQPVAPGYAGYPGYPGYAGSMPYPPATQLPSQPLAPGAVDAASQQGAASPPTYPGYPGYPAYPTYPAAGTYPSYPSYPAYAGAGYPGYPASPSAPLGAPFAVATATAEAKPKRPPVRFARPFPRWLTLLISAGVVVLLATVFGLSDLFNGNDLGGAAFISGIVALALAIVSLVVWLVRIGLGRRAGIAITLGLLLVALTTGAGVGGILGANPIRLAQARSLEAHGQWQGAIRLYGLAGEHGAAASDIARAYDEWGEARLAQRQYAAAASRFTTVITAYAQSGATLVNRASRGLFNTYVAWVGAGGVGAPLNDILTYLEGYQNSPLCDTQCQATFADADAHTYYLAALQRYQKGDLVGAASAFTSLRLLYPDSPYVLQGHAVEAQVFYAYAQQQLSTACESARPLYQTLASAYSDTPEGRKAKTLLQRPVDVNGSLTGYPTNVTMTIYLSRHGAAPLTGTPTSIYFSDDYHTTLNRSDGSYHFTNILPGSYTISADDGISTEWWGDSSTNKLYFFQAGPLCATTVEALDDHLQQGD